MQIWQGIWNSASSIMHVKTNFTLNNIIHDDWLIGNKHLESYKWPCAFKGTHLNEWHNIWTGFLAMYLVVSSVKNAYQLQHHFMSFTQSVPNMYYAIPISMIVQWILLHNIQTIIYELVISHINYWSKTCRSHCKLKVRLWILSISWKFSFMNNIEHEINIKYLML